MKTQLFIKKSWLKKLPKYRLSPENPDTYLYTSGMNKNVFGSLSKAFDFAQENSEDTPLDKVEFVILDDVFSGKDGITWNNSTDGPIKNFTTTDAIGIMEHSESRKEGSSFSKTLKSLEKSKIPSVRSLNWTLGKVAGEDAGEGDEIVTATGFKNVTLHGTKTEDGEIAEIANLFGGGVTTIEHTKNRTSSPQSYSKTEKMTISSVAGGSLTADRGAQLGMVSGFWRGDFDDDDDLPYDTPSDNIFRTEIDNPSSFGEWEFFGGTLLDPEFLAGYATVSLSGGASAEYLSGGSHSISRSREFTEAFDGEKFHTKIFQKETRSDKATGKLTIDNADVEDATGYATVTITGPGAGADRLQAGKYSSLITTSETSSYDDDDTWTGKLSRSSSRTSELSGTLTIIGKGDGSTHGAGAEMVMDYATVKLEDAGVDCFEMCGKCSMQFSATEEVVTDQLKKATASKSKKMLDAGSLVCKDSSIGAVYTKFKSVTVENSEIEELGDWDDDEWNTTASHKAVLTRETKGDWEDLYKRTDSVTYTKSGGMAVKLTSSSIGESIANAISVTAKDSSVAYILGMKAGSRTVKDVCRGALHDVKLLSEDSDSIQNVKDAVTREYTEKITDSGKMTVTLIDSAAKAIDNAQKVTASAREKNDKYCIGNIQGCGKGTLTVTYQYGLDEKRKNADPGTLRGKYFEKREADGSVSLTNINVIGYEDDDGDVKGSILGYRSVTLQNSAVAGDIASGGCYTGTKEYSGNFDTLEEAGDYMGSGSLDRTQTLAGSLTITGSRDADGEIETTVGGSIICFQNVTLAEYNGAAVKVLKNIGEDSFEVTEVTKATLTVTGKNEDIHEVCGIVTGFTTINVKSAFRVEDGIYGTSGNDKINSYSFLEISDGGISTEDGDDTLNFYGETIIAGDVELDNSMVTGYNDTLNVYGSVTIGTEEDFASLNFGYHGGENKDTLNVKGKLSVWGGVAFGSGKNIFKVDGQATIGDLWSGGENIITVNGLLKVAGDIEFSSGSTQCSGSGDIAMLKGQNVATVLQMKWDEDAGYYHRADGKGPKVVQFENFASMEGFQGVKWEQADDVKARKTNLDSEGWLCGGYGVDHNFSDLTDILLLQFKENEDVTAEINLNFSGATLQDQVSWTIDNGVTQTWQYTDASETFHTIWCDCSDGKKHTLKLKLTSGGTGEGKPGTVTYNVQRQLF